MRYSNHYSKVLLGVLLSTVSLFASADIASSKGSTVIVTTKSTFPSPTIIKLKYDDSCAACHATGEFQAPLTGDNVTWASLMSIYGMSKLVDNVKDGMSQMPAGGLCSDCSDADYKALIEFMSQ